MVGPLEHGNLRSGASGNVRKLSCDVTATNQHNSRRQALQLKKAVTGDNVFRAIDPERHRTRASSNKDVTRLELLSCHGNCVGFSEPRKAVKSINALRGIMSLLLLGHWVSKGAFEGDEFRPIDPKFACYPVTLHAASGINCLGTADEHFLGITSAQCTGSAERTMIHDGNRPARLSDPRARDLSGGARSNHHQVIHFHFEPPAAPKGKLGPVATKGAMPGIAPACPML